MMLLASVDLCRLARGPGLPISQESPSAVGVRAGGMLVIMTRREERRREEKGNKAEANTGRSKEIVLFQKYDY